MIYDSKLKRMKNLWQQFVGSHKTIIELWSGVLSFRMQVMQDDPMLQKYLNSTYLKKITTD